MPNLTGKTIGQLTTLTGITQDTLFPVELSGNTYNLPYSGLTQFNYEIGDYVPSEGGIVFHRHISSNTQYYLVVDTIDLSSSSSWSDVSSVIGVSAQSGFDGYTNTQSIIAQFGATTGAAFLCVANTSHGKTDWYLPSVLEWSEINQNLYLISLVLISIGGDQISYNSRYWTSTESSATNAFIRYSPANGFSATSKSSALYYVRAIRQFTI